MALMRKKNRPTGEIPTSSMADIAFLLLVFFLVTTVFDEERGAPIRGTFLIDKDGGLRVVASTSEDARILDLLELQNDAGPGFDCCREGRAVFDVGTDAANERWPKFTAAANSLGYGSTYAVPLRLRATVVGAMTLFCEQTTRLPDEGRAVAQALADIATIGLLQEQAIRRSDVLATQLQVALDSRVLIEQAKGVLFATSGVEVTDAFQLMRAYSRRNNLPVTSVARRVVDRMLTAHEMSVP